MLNRACEDSEWLGVFEQGRVSGFGAGQEIIAGAKKLLVEKKHKGISTRLRLWMLVGADFALRCGLYNRRAENVVCVARGDDTRALCGAWEQSLARSPRKGSG